MIIVTIDLSNNIEDIIINNLKYAMHARKMNLLNINLN